MRFDPADVVVSKATSNNDTTQTFSIHSWHRRRHRRRRLSPHNISINNIHQLYLQPDQPHPDWPHHRPWQPQRHSFPASTGSGLRPCRQWCNTSRRSFSQNFRACMLARWSRPGYPMTTGSRTTQKWRSRPRTCGQSSTDSGRRWL